MWVDFQILQIPLKKMSRKLASATASERLREKE